MRSGRHLGAAATLATLLAAACGPKQIPPSPPDVQAQPQALVVLLPDADTGAIGRIRVFNGSGSVDVAAARRATVVTADRQPGQVYTMSETEVKRLFGSALSALPPPPRHFILLFRFESDELTDESRALVPEILKAVKRVQAPEVAIVGHTDTLGSRTANLELGLKRANTVCAILLQAGLDPRVIDVTSHGEGDPLVKTPDNTAEPRNRRVEIAVR
jgi:outer membrane protein OmpA-like peptidoglycan-associated protein